MRKIVLGAFILFSGSLMAMTSWTSYDYKTQTRYSNISDDNGTVSIGYNYNTGKTWRVRKNRDGSFEGIDDNGHIFFGNKTTGFYTNLGKGVTCIGRGNQRSCQALNQ